jgi:hypothetical protein
VHFVDGFDHLIIEGNPNISIDYEKFVALLLFACIDAKIGCSNTYIEKVG